MCFSVSTLLSDGESVVGMDLDFSEVQSSILRMTQGRDRTAMIVTSGGLIAGYTDMSLVGERADEKLPEYAEVLKRDAARKIAFFKLCNAGQICINVNQVAVAQEVADEFLKELKREFVRQIGDAPEDNPEYPKLITGRVYEKCIRLTEAYRDRVVFGGRGNAAACRFAPTILYPVGVDEDIVQHELFCPLLPVVPFRDAEIDALLDVIAGREHPLSMYVFTSDLRWARRVMSTMQFGGGGINEVCIHMMVKGVPLNGTGHSGMGAYHGEWGFREFTHPQTVLTGRTRWNLPLREHPYGGEAGKRKLALLRLFEK